MQVVNREGETLTMIGFLRTVLVVLLVEEANSSWSVAGLLSRVRAGIRQPVITLDVPLAHTQGS